MPIEIKIPSVGESITEVQIAEWLKGEGDTVEKDENILSIETEKANMEIPAPDAGTIIKMLKKPGESAVVGEVVGHIETGNTVMIRKGEVKPDTKANVKKAVEKKPASEDKETRIMPAAQKLIDENKLDASAIRATGPGGRLLKEDVLRHLEKPEAAPALAPTPSQAPASSDDREEVVPMSPLRKAIASHLVEAQHTAALLTTFNEVDMAPVMELRATHQDAFLKRHGIKLGFMSLFIKASIDALKTYPAVNGEIRGTDIIYKNHYDIGVAIGGGKGLVVPVIRDADHLSFAELEKKIAELAGRAKENKLKLEELQGGTFTITNGGIYGSMMSTPIINPPQSGILGMHAIADRPVALNSEVVIRPMMYIALTYDHRIVDGREAVSFLKRIKDNIEDPMRMLIEV